MTHEDGPSRWRVLVVDDSADQRLITRLALENYTFRSRSVELIEADSATAAKQAIEENPDFAVAVIDVVMESDHAGLDLVRWIREDRGDATIRLVIRTGQAGLYPANSVLRDYEINDYWEKNELTVPRLQTSLTTSLRGWWDLKQRDWRTEQLRRWAYRFPSFLESSEWTTLLSQMMVHWAERYPEVGLSAFVCRNDGSRWPLVTGTGRYPSDGASDVLPFLDESRAAVLLEAWNQRGIAESLDAQALYFTPFDGRGHLIFLELPLGWPDYDRNITRLVLQNLRAVIENRSLQSQVVHLKRELGALRADQTSIARSLHHQFQSDLQVLLSFLGVESQNSNGLTGRTPLAGVERRLQVLAVLHTLLHRSGGESEIDLQELLQAVVRTEMDQHHRPSEPLVSCRGVPVLVVGSVAARVALSVTEMLDLIRAPRFRSLDRSEIEIVVSDIPRQVRVGCSSGRLDLGSESPPLEWKLLELLAEQVHGQLTWSAQAIVLRF